MTRIQSPSNQPAAANPIVVINIPAVQIDETRACDCSEDAPWQKPAAICCVVGGTCAIILAIANGFECFMGC